ncbi:hypothetical protein PoB_003838000 [Plakobranchus ocellatus]|uniref:Uncharacterized protein n=1 Tax=Plakobranchus ocellatus TaxID=259542 RepID=A0AAV4AU62_9GAST|nr:hypothetical protein PoB_003838000 [Plakobranchus ocellatus]
MTSAMVSAIKSDSLRVLLTTTRHASPDFSWARAQIKPEHYVPVFQSQGDEVIASVTGVARQNDSHARQTLESDWRPPETL